MLSSTVQVEAITFGAMLAWGLWGFHTSSFSRLVAVLCRRHAIPRFLLIACFAGYITSTLIIGLSSFVVWEYVRVGFRKGLQPTALKGPTIATDFAWYTSVVISDSVQVWRCLTLCGKRKWSVATLGLLLASTLVMGVVNFALSIVFAIDPNFAPFAVLERLQEGTLLAFLIPSVLLNVIATSTILIRVHLHSKEILSTFGSQHRSIKRLRLLNIFLLEGGVIYTLIQCTYATAAILGSTGHENADLVVASRPAVAVISGMYPVTITLFAELARDMTDHYNTQLASAGSSSIGLIPPRPNWAALQGLQTPNRVQLTVSRTKFVNDGDSSVFEIGHSDHELSFTT